MTDAFNEKIRMYHRFAALTQYRTVPYVMSTYGVVAKETRELIQDWRKYAPEPGFIYDIYSNCQMALIRSHLQTYNFVKNKFQLMRAHEIWRQISDPSG
jgi:hypothetical protein